MLEYLLNSFKNRLNVSLIEWFRVIEQDETSRNGKREFSFVDFEKFNKESNNELINGLNQDLELVGIIIKECKSNLVFKLLVWFYGYLSIYDTFSFKIHLQNQNLSKLLLKLNSNNINSSEDQFIGILGFINSVTLTQEQYNINEIIHLFKEPLLQVSQLYKNQHFIDNCVINLFYTILTRLSNETDSKLFYNFIIPYLFKINSKIFIKLLNGNKDEVEKSYYPEIILEEMKLYQDLKYTHYFNDIGSWLNNSGDGSDTDQVYELVLFLLNSSKMGLIGNEDQVLELLFNEKYNEKLKEYKIFLSIKFNFLLLNYQPFIQDQVKFENYYLQFINRDYFSTCIQDSITKECTLRYLEDFISTIPTSTIDFKIKLLNSIITNIIGISDPIDSFTNFEYSLNAITSILVFCNGDDDESRFKIGYSDLFVGFISNLKNQISFPVRDHSTFKLYIERLFSFYKILYESGNGSDDMDYFFILSSIFSFISITTSKLNHLKNEYINIMLIGLLQLKTKDVFYKYQKKMLLDLNISQEVTDAIIKLQIKQDTLYLNYNNSYGDILPLNVIYPASLFQVCWRENNGIKSNVESSIDNICHQLKLQYLTDQDKEIITPTIYKSLFNLMSSSLSISLFYEMHLKNINEEYKQFDLPYLLSLNESISTNSDQTYTQCIDYLILSIKLFKCNITNTQIESILKHGEKNNRVFKKLSSLLLSCTEFQVDHYFLNCPIEKMKKKLLKSKTFQVRFPNLFLKLQENKPPVPFGNVENKVILYEIFSKLFQDKSISNQCKFNNYSMVSKDIFNYSSSFFSSINDKEIEFNQIDKQYCIWKSKNILYLNLSKPISDLHITFINLNWVLIDCSNDNIQPIMKSIIKLKENSLTSLKTIELNNVSVVIEKQVAQLFKLFDNDGIQDSTIIVHHLLGGDCHYGNSSKLRIQLNVKPPLPPPTQEPFDNYILKSISKLEIGYKYSSKNLNQLFDDCLLVNSNLKTVKVISNIGNMDSLFHDNIKDLTLHGIDHLEFDLQYIPVALHDTINIDKLLTRCAHKFRELFKFLNNQYVKVGYTLKSFSINCPFHLLDFDQWNDMEFGQYILPPHANYNNFNIFYFKN